MRFDDIMRYVPVNEDWENTPDEGRRRRYEKRAQQGLRGNRDYHQAKFEMDRQKGIGGDAGDISQYSPSDEDEEGNNRRWERSEAASDVEERFTMKKNNKHIVNEEFDGEFDGPRMDLVKDMKRTVLAKAMEYDGQVSRSSLEYSLRKYYPEATDEEIEMAINGDDDAFGESTEPERTFDARTFSQMAWLGESSETLEYSTPYVDGETAPENTVDDEDAIRSLMSAWNRIADRFAERMRQHGYSPQLADAIVTAAAGRFYKSIESGI